MVLKKNSQDFITGWVTKTKEFEYWDLSSLELENDNSLLGNFSKIKNYIDNNAPTYPHFTLDGNDGYYKLMVLS